MSEPKPQADKFGDLARALECDEDEARFNEVLGKIARQKPTDKKPEKDEPGQ